MRALLAALILCACAIVPAQAAHRHHHHRHHLAPGDLRQAQHVQPWAWSAPVEVHHGRPSDCYGIRWCGCYLRHLLGIADRDLNRAIAWTHWGRSTFAHVGAVAVWPHHVGIIRGTPDQAGRWLVESGNDGHAVRTRYRSLAGVVAFRE
jgi:hypothetical protein